jgi:hypothetical protein
MLFHELELLFHLLEQGLTGGELPTSGDEDDFSAAHNSAFPDSAPLNAEARKIE